MRLSVEVLEAVRAAVPDGFPIGVRICLDEFTTFGYGLDYGLRMPSIWSAPAASITTMPGRFLATGWKSRPPP